MLLIATFIYACIIMRNFGRGLKEQSVFFLHVRVHEWVLVSSGPSLVSKKQETAFGTSKHGAYPSMSVRANRMSID